MTRNRLSFFAIRFHSLLGTLFLGVGLFGVGLFGVSGTLHAAGEVSIPQPQTPQIPQTNGRGFGGGGTGAGSLDRGPASGAGAIAPPTTPAPNASPSGPDNVQRLFKPNGAAAKNDGKKDKESEQLAILAEHLVLTGTEVTRQLRLRADKDDADAQYRLGGLYYNGGTFAVPISEEVSVLGKTSVSYVSTVPADRAKAIEWWEKASRNGSGAAAVALAEFYAPSSGTEPNLPRSFAWYRKASELGDHGAEATYGSLLIQLSNDPVTRKDFFTNFPKPDSPAYKKLQEITPNFTELPKDTGDLYELGFQSLKVASDAGYLPAQRDLSIELNSERSPHFDRKEAYRLFDLLVEKNETIIFLHYGLSIVNFGETKEEFLKAHKLLETATEMGENRAYRGLATLYAKGRGVKRNPSKAFLYANKCAEVALDFCGDFIMNSYGQGNLSFGFKKDSELALYWARRIAQAGIPSGYQFLSLNYLNRSKETKAEAERNHYLYLAYLFRQMAVKDGDVESLQLTNRIYRQMGEEERNRANEFLSKWRASDPLPE